MNFWALAVGLTFLLFFGMLLCGYVGHRLARRQAARKPDSAGQGIGVVDGAVFALLGLVIAFTFSGAAGRFDERRAMVIEEANALGTAYLRVDLLPDDTEPAIRETFRSYLDSRLEVYRLLPDLDAAMIELDNSKVLQAELWTQAVTAAEGNQPATMLLLPELNQAFDMAELRFYATTIHPPSIIFAMLIVLALIGAGLAGYSMGKAPSTNWFYLIAFAGVMSLVFFVIFNLEYPRLGLLRIDGMDQALVDLRASIE